MEHSQSLHLLYTRVANEKMENWKKRARRQWKKWQQKFIALASTTLYNLKRINFKKKEDDDFNF